MGVKLKDIIRPEQIDFKDLKGRAISIDAFNTLYQFLSTIRQRDGRPLSDSNGNITSHLSGILYRNSSMIEKDIKPIYVFDGTPSYLKQETIDQRRQTREESEKKLEQTKVNLIRINDILTEIESNLEPLRLQSEKAKKFLDLREELKNIEIGLFIYKIDSY